MLMRFTKWLTLAAAAASLTACASQTAQPVTDWNFTNLPPVEQRDVPSRTERHTNPPPPPVYADYMDEPTRFEFHRHIIYFDENGDEIDPGAMDEGGGSGDEGY
ncbi:MAG TPA: hypothetical protein VGN88_07410 [Phycisphaerae bacterium]|jgi:hypothetical protein